MKNEDGCWMKIDLVDFAQGNSDRRSQAILLARGLGVHVYREMSEGHVFADV